MKSYECLAREEAPPDEVVKLLLRRLEARAFGRARDVGRADGLVRALRVGLRPVDIRLLGIVRGAEGGDDVVLRRSPRLLGDVHRIRSHVGDEPLLVKRLRELHRLAGREAENARRGLLKRRRGERRQRMASLRLRLDVDDLELGAGQVKEDVVRALLRLDLWLLPVDAGQPRGERPLVARLLRLDPHQEVGLGLECVDLALALDEQTQSDRLHAPRRQRAVVRAVDVLPQQRRHLVADDPVEDAPRLLRVDKRHVDVARLRDRLENGRLGDLVVGDATERLLARDRPKHLL